MTNASAGAFISAAATTILAAQHMQSHLGLVLLLGVDHNAVHLAEDGVVLAAAHVLTRVPLHGQTNGQTWSNIVRQLELVLSLLWM
jgi:hypothetical protein